jgi:protein-tyrosine phosphatase
MFSNIPSNPADEIVPGLWLGNRNAALDKEFLQSNKIHAVFNCTKDIPFDDSVQRRYRVPVDDNLQQVEIRNMELWSPEIVVKIIAELKDGPILVHCAAGMQRSAAATAMYLIATKGITTEEAVKFIQSKRPIAFRPAVNFEAAIRGFERLFDRDIRPNLIPT